MLSFLFLQSHPIQYFSPLYRQVHAQPDMQLAALYASRAGLDKQMDQEFGVEVQWDIPLLEGYPAVFLRNHSPIGSKDKGFWGLINLGLARQLRKQPRSYVVVPGWKYATFVACILLAPWYGHRVCLRLETPLRQELQKSGWKTRLRQWVMRHLLFPRVSYFLYIGQQNKRFYQHFGVPERQLLFSPYAVDNSRFGSAYAQYAGRKSAVRKELGLPEQAVITLCSGKYIAKKNPLDAIRAFHRAKKKAAHPSYLVMVGDGPLRRQMETLIEQLGLHDVKLTGFVNQSLIPKYYAAADIFLMPSGMGETWGLSTNEAMNFQLPVVQYALTGSADDLVEEGQNGFVVPNGDIGRLAQKLVVLINDEDFRIKAGQHSKTIVQRYSYDTIIQRLRQLPAL